MMDNYKYVDGLIDSVHVRTSRRPYYTQFVDAEYLYQYQICSIAEKFNCVGTKKHTFLCSPSSESVWLWRWWGPGMWSLQMEENKKWIFLYAKKKNLCVCSRDRTMIDDANQLISLLTIQWCSGGNISNRTWAEEYPWPWLTSIKC